MRLRMVAAILIATAIGYLILFYYMGWLDYILMPSMALFAVLTGYAFLRPLRRRSN